MAEEERLSGVLPPYGHDHKAMGAHGRHREGVLWHQPTATDLLFITLRISEALFSLTTRYRDLALGPSLFHWESHEGSGRWRSAGGWSGRFRRYSYR